MFFIRDYKKPKKGLTRLTQTDFRLKIFNFIFEGAGNIKFFYSVRYYVPYSSLGIWYAFRTTVNRIYASNSKMIGISQIIIALSNTKKSLHKFCRHVFYILNISVLRTCKFLVCINRPSFTNKSTKDDGLLLQIILGHLSFSLLSLLFIKQLRHTDTTRY